MALGTYYLFRKLFPLWGLVLKDDAHHRAPCTRHDGLLDEAFCLCDGMSDDQLHQVAVQIRARVLAWCGLGTGAGIGPTLAKLASYAAKRVTKSGLVNLMQP